MGEGDLRLPLIWISKPDFVRLSLLAERLMAEDEALARFLAAELDRAIVCRASDVPPDVVSMHSFVRFRRDAGRPAEVGILAYPEDGPVENAIPITSHLGVALLGMRAGWPLSYRERDGEARQLVVEKVIGRPEPAETESGSSGASAAGALVATQHGRRS